MSTESMGNVQGGPGHMTKMAAIPIHVYGKTFKNLLLQNQKFYDHETWHVASGTQSLQNYRIDMPGLTMIYFIERSNWVTYTFNGENLQQRTKLTELMKNNLPQGVVCPCPGLHVYDHLFQSSSSLNQSQISCGVSLGRGKGKESLYKWSRSHDQDGRHAHI